MAIAFPPSGTAPLAGVEPRERATAPEPRPAAESVRPQAASTFWEMLTPTEREFFLQQQSLGCLTYRSDGQAGSAPQAPIGQRVDTRG